MMFIFYDFFSTKSPLIQILLPEGCGKVPGSNIYSDSFPGVFETLLVQLDVPQGLLHSPKQVKIGWSQI
jgi:hypothetical protein